MITELAPAGTVGETCPRTCHWRWRICICAREEGIRQGEMNTPREIVELTIVVNCNEKSPQAGPWTPESAVEDPEAVRQLHREFLRAGADVMQA